VAAGPFLTATPAPPTQDTPTAQPTPAASQSVPTATPAPGDGAAATTPTPPPVLASGSAPTPGGTPLPAPTPATSSGAYRDRENRLALLLDRARVVAGLLPLARSPELDRSAAAHAADMVAAGYMDHVGLDGSTPGTRAQRAGYAFPAGSGWMAIETITAASDAPEGALAWLLTDGLHARVVLRSTWREMGVAYAPGGPYGRFWVLEFGCRPNVLPPVLLDGALSIPDETCAHGGGAFDRVQSVRVGERSDSARGQAWDAYIAQRPWPAGRPAVVELRDTAGRELEMVAADPTGAPAETP
jgi:uncharacterized protein YkwD